MHLMHCACSVVQIDASHSVPDEPTACHGTCHGTFYAGHTPQLLLISIRVVQQLSGIFNQRPTDAESFSATVKEAEEQQEAHQQRLKYGVSKALGFSL